MFAYNEEKLRELSEKSLSLSLQKGATAAEVDVYESVGQELGVRLLEVEKIEYQQDTCLNVTVFVGQRKGFAATADFSAESIERTVEAALDIARYTAEDSCAGLADKELMAKEIHDLDLYHESSFSLEDARIMAMRCEDAALSFDKRISNSDGASVSYDYSQAVYANTHGFVAYDRRTRYNTSCILLAQDDAGMQRDYWSDTTRAVSDLLSPEEIGKIAAERTISRLSPRCLPTGKYPVLFDRLVSGSLIGHLTHGLSGGVLYRKSSFLCDSLGKKIFPDFVCLREEPHLKRTFATTYYDDEGVATYPHDIVRNGEIASYFLSSYSARKLGMKTTANAGGIHHLTLNPTVATQQELLQKMGTGLFVTELMGQGVNILTGDYSRGASGFWVENGEIAYPVEEVTIALTLPQIFATVVGIADDAILHSSHRVGSILIEQMTVAGK